MVQNCICAKFGDFKSFLCAWMSIISCQIKKWPLRKVAFFLQKLSDTNEKFREFFIELLHNCKSYLGMVRLLRPPSQQTTQSQFWVMNLGSAIVNLCRIQSKDATMSRTKSMPTFWSLLWFDYLFTHKNRYFVRMRSSNSLVKIKTLKQT